MRSQRGELLAALGLSGDPRAAASASATGSAAGDPDDREIARSRWLAELTVPSADDVTACARELRAAAARVAGPSGTPADQARRLVTVLRAGLDHHSEHGDGPCPLCGTGTLDDAWRRSAAAEAERLAALADDATTAHDAIRRAVAAAHALATDPPGLLGPPLPPPAPPDGAPTSGTRPTFRTTGMTATHAARAAWLAWADLRSITEPDRLASRRPARS